MSEAPARERDALANLVAARKMFQKAISDNPDAFRDADPNDADPPTWCATRRPFKQSVACLPDPMHAR